MCIPFSAGLLSVTEKEKKKHMLTEQIGISGKFVPDDYSNFKYAFFRKNNNNNSSISTQQTTKAYGLTLKASLTVLRLLTNDTHKMFQALLPMLCFPLL